MVDIWIDKDGGKDILNIEKNIREITEVGFYVLFWGMESIFFDGKSFSIGYVINF